VAEQPGAGVRRVLAALLRQLCDGGVERVDLRAPPGAKALCSLRGVPDRVARADDALLARAAGQSSVRVCRRRLAGSANKLAILHELSGAGELQ